MCQVSGYGDVAGTWHHLSHSGNKVDLKHI